MLLYTTVLLFGILHIALSGPLHVGDSTPEFRPAREVGGSISRNLPSPTAYGDFRDERSEREVNGAITRNQPGIAPNKRDADEIWTIVQTNEEHLTMDSLRGKDVPLSLTEDFRGIEPVLPADYDELEYLTVYKL